MRRCTNLDLPGATMTNSFDRRHFFYISGISAAGTLLPSAKLGGGPPQTLPGATPLTLEELPSAVVLRNGAETVRITRLRSRRDSCRRRPRSPCGGFPSDSLDHRSVLLATARAHSHAGSRDAAHIQALSGNQLKDGASPFLGSQPKNTFAGIRACPTLLRSDGSQRGKALPS